MQPAGFLWFALQNPLHALMREVVAALLHVPRDCPERLALPMQAAYALDGGLFLGDGL